MKNIKWLLLWVAVFGIASLHTANAENNVGKPNFEISLKDDLYVGNRAEKAWTIKYENARAQVTVVKHLTSEGVAYSVHSDFFDVCCAICAPKKASAQPGFAKIGVSSTLKLAGLSLIQMNWPDKKYSLPAKSTMRMLWV